MPYAGTLSGDAVAFRMYVSLGVYPFPHVAEEEPGQIPRPEDTRGSDPLHNQVMHSPPCLKTAWPATQESYYAYCRHCYILPPHMRHSGAEEDLYHNSVLTTYISSLFNLQQQRAWCGL